MSFFFSKGNINAQIDAIPDQQKPGNVWQLVLPAYTHADRNRPACFKVNSWLVWMSISWQRDTSSPPCSINCSASHHDTIVKRRLKRRQCADYSTAPHCNGVEINCLPERLCHNHSGLFIATSPSPKPLFLMRYQLIRILIDHRGQTQRGRSAACQQARQARTWDRRPAGGDMQRRCV